MTAATLAEQIGVEEVNRDEFISRCLPIKMANSLSIAYGGCALAVAINAAVKTVKQSFYLYSVLGHFLGPARIDLRLKCRVHRLRDTRTFSTRQVEVTQVLKTGETRLCLALMADFQINEATMYDYSIPPVLQYRHATECLTAEEIAKGLIEKSYLSEKEGKAYSIMFRDMHSFFDSRLCLEGVAGQNLSGYAKSAPTTQDHLHITSKVSGDWFRAKMPLSKVDQFAGLAFMMDAGLSFAPLVHDHKYLEDAGACSSLDFALRIFVVDVDINSWHLREKMTLRGAVGRTFTEARLWNEQGKMLASMSQQCILRPMPPPKPEL